MLYVINIGPDALLRSAYLVYMLVRRPSNTSGLSVRRVTWHDQQLDEEQSSTSVGYLSSRTVLKSKVHDYPD